MIVTDKLVFIHLHRTGGRFIRSLLLKYQKDAQEIGYHFPARLIPWAFRDRPVIGFIRNPSEWYRSWYAFNRTKAQSALYRIASKEGTLGLNETITNLLYLGSEQTQNQNLKMQVVDALPRSILGNRGAGITREELANFNDEQTGYYGWLVQRMYAGLADPPQLKLGQFEHFRRDLRQIFLACGYSADCALLNALASSPPLNSSDYSHLDNQCNLTYSSTTLDSIAQQERKLITHYHY